MRKQAFSLAEMIITLLILSIIMAASAPLITKRQKLNNMFDCFWRENKNIEGVISFAQGGKGSVGIGIKPENKDYILHLRSSDSGNARNIAFYDTNSNLVGSLGFYGNNIYFGNGDISGDNNVVIGQASAAGVDGETLSIGPVSYLSPLIYGKFSAQPYVQINGQLFIKPTNLPENNYAMTLEGPIFSGGGGSSSYFSSLSSESLSVDVLDVNTSLNMNSKSINNAVIEYGAFIEGNLEGSVLESVNINNSTIAGTNIFDGNVDFSNATVTGLKVDLINGEITSDIRKKDVIGETKVGIDEIREIKIKEYKWKDKRDKETHIGIIAQELEKVLPSIVLKDECGYLKIKPIELIFIVINAIKQLDKELELIKSDLMKEEDPLIKPEQKSIKKLRYRIKILQVENKNLKKELEIINCENKKILKRLEKLENSLNIK